ncbi:MAG: hypothetical protein HY554_18630 [Elusimicrobia bacterium]|nr:hypothetical protein [Elusimicrobiota bacterium]
MRPAFPFARAWWLAAFAVIAAGVVTAALRPRQDVRGSRAAFAKAPPRPGEAGAPARLREPGGAEATSRPGAPADGGEEDSEGGPIRSEELAAMQAILDERAERREGPVAPAAETAIDRPREARPVDARSQARRRGPLALPSGERFRAAARSAARLGGRQAAAAGASPGIAAPASDPRAHASRVFYRSFEDGALGAMLERRKAGASLAASCRNASLAANCQQAAQACSRDKACVGWLGGEGGIGADLAFTRSVGLSYAAKEGEGGAATASRDAKMGAGSSRVASAQEPLPPPPAVPAPASTPPPAPTPMPRTDDPVNPVVDPPPDPPDPPRPPPGPFDSMAPENRRKIEAYYDARCINAPQADAVCDFAQVCVEVSLYPECLAACAGNPSCNFSLPEPPPGRLCDTKTYSCGARYGAYQFGFSRSEQTVTAYQSCSITQARYDALKPSGATRVNRSYEADCPQCWVDTHRFQGEEWTCARSLGGFRFGNFQSSFPVKYHVSCDLDPDVRATLERQGYVYAASAKARSMGPAAGEWTDVHAMKTRCPATP